MKKILIFIFIISLSKISIAQTSQEASAMPLVQIGADFPDLYLQKTDSSIFKSNDLAKEKYRLLMLFHPTCDHCIEQTKTFINLNEKYFKNIDFILVAGDQMMPYMSSFENSAGYKKEKNFNIGIDLLKKINELFLYNGLPQIMCYGKNGKLEKIFTRDVKLEEILNTFKIPFDKKTIATDVKENSVENRRQKLVEEQQNKNVANNDTMPKTKKSKKKKSKL